MQLQDRLDAIRQGFEKKATPEALAIMHRATDDLAATGQADRAVGEGQAMPEFELPDSQGRRVRSADLLEHGPLVLTFFRGKW